MYKNYLGKFISSVKIKLQSYKKIDKVLLVEGSTDEVFLNALKKNPNIMCMTPGCMISDDRMLNQSQKSNQSKFNCKEAIKEWVLMLNSPAICDDNSKFKNLKFYGLVDLDYDENSSDFSYFFVTDTHDLETLLISTDIGVLYRVLEGEISYEDINKSFFVAFQFSEARRILWKHYDKLNPDKFNIGNISSGLNSIEFSEFLNADKININKLVDYIIKKSKNKASSIKGKIQQDKQIMRKFSPNGLWKNNFENFSYDKIEDFWKKVNGHDILQLIRYFNEKAGCKYHNNREVDREFETDIINNYNYANIRTTKLYAKLKKEKIVSF